MRKVMPLLAILVLASCGSVSTGSPDSDYKVGMMYLEGIGVTQDPHEAYAWIRKAAEAGDARGQFRLGVLYESGLGVDKNQEAAVEWYAQAAAQGLTAAIYNLGNAYRTGVGIDRSYEKALALYKEAALKGYGPAAHNVGAMTGNGEGTPQSDAEAYWWLLLASKLGVNADVKYMEKFRPSLSTATQKQIRTSVETMLQQIRSAAGSGSTTL